MDKIKTGPLEEELTEAALMKLALIVLEEEVLKEMGLMDPYAAKLVQA